MKKSKKLLNLYCILIFILMFISTVVLTIDSKIVYGSTPELKDENWGLHNAQVFEAQQITKGRDEILCINTKY